MKYKAFTADNVNQLAVLNRQKQQLPVGKFSVKAAKAGNKVVNQYLCAKEMLLQDVIQAYSDYFIRY
jgi:hypothetical protein